MNVKVLISFIIGAAAGAVSTYFYTTKRYEELMKKETEELKETYSKKNAVDISEVSSPSNEIKEEVKEDRADSKTRYSDISNKSRRKERRNKESKVYTNTNVIRIIKPEEFAENDDYDAITMMYTADGTVTDSDYQKLTGTEIERLIGLESLKHFGEYEDENEADSLYVRNDRLKTDIEVLLEPRTYDEILDERPYLMDEV